MSAGSHLTRLPSAATLLDDNERVVKALPEPSNPVLIQHLAPKNFLSFGPNNPGIELRALNLIIGPNGSGKSNLIEAINLMRATPKEVRDLHPQGRRSR